MLIMPSFYDSFEERVVFININQTAFIKPSLNYRKLQDLSSGLQHSVKMWNIEFTASRILVLSSWAHNFMFC